MTTDDLRNTVRAVSEMLTGLGIPFHFTGGVVTLIYGEPRFTYDVDVVVRLEEGDLERILDRLESAFDVDSVGARSAVRTNRMFHAYHKAGFVKVDFHVGERIPGELQRSIEGELFSGIPVPVLCLEDAILSKLIWLRMGSHKARHDIVGMLRRGLPYDRDLLDDLAQQLRVSDLLRDCERRAAGNLEPGESAVD